MKGGDFAWCMQKHSQIKPSHSSYLLFRCYAKRRSKCVHVRKMKAYHFKLNAFLRKGSAGFIKELKKFKARCREAGRERHKVDERRSSSDMA